MTLVPSSRCCAAATNQQVLGRVVLDDHRGAPSARVHVDVDEPVHVCLLVRGAFEESRSRETVARSAGSLRISPSGDRHRVSFGKDGSQCVMIRILGDDVLVAPPRRFMVTDDRATAALGWRLLREGRQASAVSPLTALELALEIFARLGRRAAARRTRVAPVWLDRVRTYVRSTPTSPPTLDQLADLAHTHPVHLVRAFKARFGYTPGAYARFARLRLASRLAEDSALPLARIAAEAGYCDQSHMTREFQRLIGVTPLEFRRRASSVTASR